MGCGLGYTLTHPPEPFVDTESRNPASVIWGAGAMISTMITNICATSLIAYRIWYIVSASPLPAYLLLFQGPIIV